MRYCTLSDSKYIYQGIALMESLLTDQDFMYYLCLDNESYNIIINYNINKGIPTNIYAIKLQAFEMEVPELTEYKNTVSYQNYCWALASHLSYYLLKRNNEPICYIDSDIYFFGDPNEIFKAIGNLSIGIHTHRFNHDKPTKTGKYNVGVIYFKNDTVGTQCLEWWKDVVINPKGYEDYASCGDQKFLELFPPLFGATNICEIESIGHLASWNCHHHSYTDNQIIWKGVHQDLIFFHFSHFTSDFKNNCYHTNHKGEWRPENTPAKKYYDAYFEVIKKVKILIDSL